MVNWVRAKAPKGGQAADVTFFIKPNLISAARRTMGARDQDVVGRGAGTASLNETLA